MKKQVLTIKDLTTIYVLLDNEITRRSRFETFWMPEDKIEQERKAFEENLKRDVYYQKLLRLQESLEKIKIQVECPDIEIKNKAKRKGE